MRVLIAGCGILAACLAAVLLFDVLAWFFAPASLTGFAPDYRLPMSTRIDPTRLGMEGYYRADPVMGFDIAPSQKGRHLRTLPGMGMVPADSSDLGCRDSRNLADLQKLDDWVYFAGDSFTWGWTRSGDLAFPAVYERASGNPALNCGVSGTGPLKQLEKFRKTVRAIGHHPRRVVVGRYPNDVPEDMCLTCRTVVRGMVVETGRAATLPAPLGMRRAGRMDELGPSLRGVQVSPQALEEQVRKYKAWRLSRTYRLHQWVLQYSLSYQMGYYLANTARTSAGGTPARGTGTTRKRQDFLQSPHTRPHRAALKAWAEDARKHGYQLTFVLIPPHEYLTEQPDPRRAQVIALLRSLGIHHLDFLEYARSKGLRRKHLYWPHDPHLSEEGNHILGEWLAQQLP